MSQKLLLAVPSKLFLLLVLQLFIVCHAYPYIFLSSLGSSNEPRRVTKRAFDRFDNSGVFSFGAKRLDLFDHYDFDDSKDVYKRAFDRIDQSDFGLRKKRSFDRMGGTEFGLMKRSGRVELIDDLSDAIMSLRRARAASPLTFQ